MIYTETRRIDAKQMNEVGEDIIYKEMVADMIKWMPTHKVKKLFPVKWDDAKEPSNTYVARIVIDI